PADGGALLGGEPAGLLAGEPRVVFLEPLLGDERLLPGALERPRHQPVLGLAGVVLPRRPLRLVGGALAPELPEPAQLGPPRPAAARGSAGAAGSSAASTRAVTNASRQAPGICWHRGSP